MSISTLSLNNASRASLMRLQSELKDANKELVTERHADVGATLGRLTGSAVSYRAQETSIDAQLETNKVVTGRLDIVENLMASVAATGDEMIGSMLNADLVEDYDGLARAALQQMAGALNTSVNGLYVFGGENSGVAPIADIAPAIQAAKDAYGSFLTAINKTAATVTADEMTKFLSAAGYTDPPASAAAPLRFMDTVADAAWVGPATPPATVWSNASSRETTASISRTETVQTSVSANESAFRSVAAAYSMLAAIASPELNDAARTALARSAATTLKAGLDGVTALRASVGTREARVDAANEALKRQKDVVNAAFTRLEGVDQTEAGLRITQLETLLQASYTVTGRLQKLSILDYL